MKFGEFMAKLRAGVPHAVLSAGEEPYYIEKAEKAILAALFPDGAEQAEAVQYLERDPSPYDLAEMLETIPFLSEKSVLVLRGTNFFREKKGVVEDAPKGKRPGHGLGLEILRNLAERHNGMLETQRDGDRFTTHVQLVLD